MPDRSDRLHVFLAHASEDSELARAVIARLEQRKVNAWVYDFVVDAEPNAAEQISRAVPAHGYLLLLTSPAMLRTDWIGRNLDEQSLQDLIDRGVTVIPVAVDDIDIPKSIARLQRVSMQSSLADLDHLVDQIDVAPLIDLEAMSPKLFESLVYDLLLRLGFRDSLDSSAQRPPVGDFVVDFVSNDPFGAERTDTWIVEAKHHRDERVDPFGVWQLASYVGTNRRISSGLLITNGRLTSSTRRTLADAEQKSGSSIRVVDGAELRALLVKHPDVVTRYFPSGVGARANG